MSCLDSDVIGIAPPVLVDEKGLVPSHSPPKISVFCHDGFRKNTWKNHGENYLPDRRMAEKIGGAGSGCNSQNWSTPKKSDMRRVHTMSCLTWWSSRTIVSHGRQAHAFEKRETWWYIGDTNLWFNEPWSRNWWIQMSGRQRNCSENPWLHFCWTHLVYHCVCYWKAQRQSDLLLFAGAPSLIRCCHQKILRVPKISENFGEKRNLRFFFDFHIAWFSM